MNKEEIDKLPKYPKKHRINGGDKATDNITASEEGLRKYDPSKPSIVCDPNDKTWSMIVEEKATEKGLTVGQLPPAKASGVPLVSDDLSFQFSLRSWFSMRRLIPNWYQGRTTIGWLTSRWLSVIRPFTIGVEQPALQPSHKLLRVKSVARYMGCKIKRRYFYQVFIPSGDTIPITARSGVFT